MRYVLLLFSVIAAGIGGLLLAFTRTSFDLIAAEIPFISATIFFAGFLILEDRAGKLASESVRQESANKELQKEVRRTNELLEWIGVEMQKMNPNLPRE